MTDRYSETQTIAAVARLTRTQLDTFVAADIITPLLTDSGPVFRQIDIVRLELLCELSEEFELDEDALGVVISLIDQLHGTRSTLRAVLDAVEKETPDVRHRITAALVQD